MYSYRYAHCPRYTIIHSNRIIKNLIYSPFYMIIQKGELIPYYKFSSL
jgi:hypothetical protein